MGLSTPNTLFLRLEGPLQSWGDNSKFVIRRTYEAPSKSGVMGLICCAMGVPRQAAPCRLRELNELRMGVRIDRRGTRWWDYHTVGAKIGVLRADGEGIKRTGGAKDDPIETLITRREYLCDASFLVALQGDPEVIGHIRHGLTSPVWPVFLGRKSCPPATPVLAGEAPCAGLLAALRHKCWRPRYNSDERAREKRVALPCLIEWRASREGATAPDDAEVWYDTPKSFAPPVHEARLLQRDEVTVTVGCALQHSTPTPRWPRPSYEAQRQQRLCKDKGLCVFCKSSQRVEAHHVTYRRAGGDETVDDLRLLCHLCHDAVTMIEYGENMGLDRINPEDPRWRDRIIQKRDEIVAFRSLGTERRHPRAEEAN